METDWPYPVDKGHEGVVERQRLYDAVDPMEYGEGAFLVGYLDVLLGDDELPLQIIESALEASLDVSVLLPFGVIGEKFGPCESTLWDLLKQLLLKRAEPWLVA